MSGLHVPRETDRQRQLLDIHGVARRLGVTERHIRRLVAERRIPYLKWGHLLRFDPNDLDEWLDASRHPAMLMMTPPWAAGSVASRGEDA